MVAIQLRAEMESFIREVRKGERQRLLERLSGFMARHFAEATEKSGVDLLALLGVWIDSEAGADKQGEN